MCLTDTVDDAAGFRDRRPPAAARTSNPSLAVACITTLQQMAELQAEWQALESRSGDRMAYFQSFDWCYKWCRQFAAGTDCRDAPRLQIFTARKNDRLAMVLPMMLVAGHLGIRKLVFIGEPLTQYGNVLVDRQLLEPSDIGACWAQITKEAQADVITLKNIPKSSALVANVTRAWLQSETSIMNLSGFADFDAFTSGLKKSTLRNRKKRRTKLARLGVLHNAVVAGGTVEYEEMVAQALAWKQIWLTQTGRVSTVLAQDDTCRFLGSLVQGAQALVLRADGKPIAIEIGFLAGDHYYAYLGAFDWALRDLSPGKVQMEEALRWAIENDVRAYDLLGNPSTYKADWSNVQMMLANHVHPLTLKGRLYAELWIKHAQPLAKRAYYRVPAKTRKALLSIPLALKDRWSGQSSSAPTGTGGRQPAPR